MDSIELCRYIEGMVSSEILGIQKDFVDFGRCSLLLDVWAKELVMKLLEITHGQWLYRNMEAHNAVNGLKGMEKRRNYRGRLSINFCKKGQG